MRTIIYKEALDLVKKVKAGLTKKILCIIIADNQCPACVGMIDDILPQVEEKYNGEIDLVELNWNSEDLIFPPEKIPICFFYVRGQDIFPIIKVGPAPLEGVLQDVGEMIKFNRKYNG